MSKVIVTKLPSEAIAPLSDAEDLVEQFKLLLGNNITTKGLDKRTTLWEDLTIEDLDANLHMYDRLFRALGALTRLRGYKTPYDWLAQLCTEEELVMALQYKRNPPMKGF